MFLRPAGKTTFLELKFIWCALQLGENRNLMHKQLLAVLLMFPALCAASAQGAPQIRNIKVAISNPGKRPRKAADIVISIAQIRKVAPDFTPGAMIVTASDA